jgi:predicted permease
MRQLLRRLWYAIRKRQFEADLAEELEFHRELKQREIEGRGVGPTEASFAARRSLGSIALAHDLSRDVWCPRWLQGIGQDMRLALRSLRGTPIVTTVAVVSLALGIGANTAIFSIVDSLLLRALPVVKPQQLVVISTPRMIGLGSGAAGWPYPVWQQVHQRSGVFDGAIAWSSQQLNLASDGETQFVEGLFVSGSYFDTLGVPAILGRTVSEADDQRSGGGAGPIVVLSYGFWQRRFGGAGDVIGRTLKLENVPFTIVGVTPPAFFGAEVGRGFDVGLPIGEEPLIRGRESWLDESGSYWLNIVLRLKQGQTIDAAQSILRSMQPQIRDATLPSNFPKPYLNRYLTEDFTLVPAATGNSLLRGRYSRPVLTILVVVVLVLLIACANIANLLFARGAARRHELSVRVALGASRWRLARQLFTESAVLAAIGAIFGTIAASWASRVIVQQLSTPTRPVFLDVSIDGRVLMFTIGVSVATALLFGTGPALQASHVAPITALKEHGGAARERARPGLSSGLIVAQVALSVVLLAAAGLFVRTFASLAGRDPGFERDRVLLVNLNSQRALEDPSERLQLYERARDVVGTLPGVADATLSEVTPALQRGGMMLNIEVSGGAAVPMTLAGGIGNGFGNRVSAGWFRTFGVPLVAGRDFTAGDRTGAPLVAIVNQALARAFLGGVSPLGHTITLSLTRDVPPREIIGIVGDVVYQSLRDAAPPTVYIPLAQPSSDGPGPVGPSVNLGVRSSAAAPALLTKSVVAGVANVNPNLTLTFRTLSDQVNASFAQERLIAMLSGFFSALSLLLAGLGLYGVTAYAVAGRRREMGIRMALGATRGRVLRLVMSRVSIQIVLGVAIGGVVSLWASKFVATLLYGLEPRDLTTLIGAAVILGGVAALAAWLPARRASRIDPAEVLREG